MEKKVFKKRDMLRVRLLTVVLLVTSMGVAQRAQADEAGIDGHFSLTCAFISVQNFPPALGIGPLLKAVCKDRSGNPQFTTLDLGERIASDDGEWNYRFGGGFGGSFVEPARLSGPIDIGLCLKGVARAADGQEITAGINLDDLVLNDDGVLRWTRYGEPLYRHIVNRDGVEWRWVNWEYWEPNQSEPEEGNSDDGSGVNDELRK